MEYQARAAEALKLLHARRYQQAIPAFRRLLHETYVTDFEYDDWLRGLADSHRALSQPLPAGYVYLYLHYFDMALGAFAAADSPLDLALCHESRGNYREASQLYLRERKLVRAAVNIENLGQYKEALPVWEQLLGEIDKTHEPYAFALARLNWAHCLKQLGESDDAMRKGLIEALVELEAIADEREQAGLLDEALDCYHLMIQIGLEQRAFENLSEGYVNAIRLLRERGRMLTALRYYAGIGETGSLWGEHHAVATLYREAAEAVQRAGMLYSGFYLKQAADSWLSVARHNIELGAPPELTENALLAGLDCFNQIDDGPSVSACYRMLAELPIGEDKTRRYVKLANQSALERRAQHELSPPSDILRRAPRIPPLWREDLLEWEGGDDSLTMLTQVVWDLNYHDTVRRKALNLVLFYLDVREQAGGANDKRLNIEVARALAHMRPKLAFRGLKKLCGHDDPEIRAEAVRSAGHTAHPSGLTLIEQGLRDNDPRVKQAAMEALPRHTYPEAFDALKRILESHDDVAVQQAVVATLARVRAFETAEYLFRMLVAGTPQEVLGYARESLQALLTQDWRRILANRARNEPPAVRERLRFLEG